MHLPGYRSAAADIAAMMHFWRYVGHLMGVQPRWHPANLKESKQISATFLLKAANTPDADGVELIESYPWPWAVIPLVQIPVNLTVDLLAHRIPTVAPLQDRYAMWRRGTWFATRWARSKQNSNRLNSSDGSDRA